MTFPQWVITKCECGGDQFVQVVNLRYHPNGGLTPQPVHWQCANCQMIYDAKIIVERMKIEQRKAELKAAQAELDELEGKDGEEEKQAPSENSKGQEAKKPDANAKASAV